MTRNAAAHALLAPLVNAARISVSVNVSAASIAALPPENGRALLEGIAALIAASSEKRL